MVSELVLFQLSSFCALVGMTLGWRGVMTRFSGFYDLPTAWNQVFWGIVLGGVYAVLADGMLFQPYFTTVVSEDGIYTGLNIISLIMVTLSPRSCPIFSFGESVYGVVVLNPHLDGRSAWLLAAWLPW